VLIAASPFELRTLFGGRERRKDRVLPGEIGKKPAEFALMRGQHQIGSGIRKPHTLTFSRQNSQGIGI
jgi:hypothetical protein